MAKRKTELSAAQQEVYRKAVQKLNKQLYRLEKHYAKSGENIMATAYSGILRDIKSFFGDQKRFSKKLPKTEREFQKYMNAISRFYAKPSATLSGMANVYGKRAKTWSKRMGANITADQMKNVFESGLYKELSDAFGSKTALKKLGFIQRQRERIMKQLAEGKKISFLGTGAKELNDIVNDPSFKFDSVLRRYYEGVAD